MRLLRILWRSKDHIMKTLCPLLALFLAIQVNLGFAQHHENKQIIEDLFLKIWNQKDFQTLKEMPGDTITFHWNNFHFKTNKTELGQMVEMWHQSFEDFKFEILGILAEGDLVAVNLRYTGKHVNTFMGTPALGNEIDVSEMMFFRFEDGVLKEAWELYDERGMAAQMKKKE